jgi:16S rRNA (cytidine1402-2'-O)-methyltransferase
MTSQAFGKLYLIPSTLGDAAPIDSIPAQSVLLLQTLDCLVVESPKTARRFLGQCGIRLSDRNIEFLVLDEHTVEAALPSLLAPLLAGRNVGLLSDAGCPAIADPGGRLVRRAHAAGVEIVPLVGPSSIALALMASGLNGQRFTFHGYLPIEAASRARTLTHLEKMARTQGETQIFIETPYRNNQMLASILQTCATESVLCVASDLTLPTQFIRTQSIGRWRGSPPDLNRRPTVFLLGGEEN